MANSTTLPLNRFSPEAKSCVANAQSLADEQGHAEVQPLHLLARMLDATPGVAQVFRLAGAEPQLVLNAAQSALHDLKKRSDDVAYLSSGLLALISRAQRQADAENQSSVRVYHLLNALSQEIRGPAADVLGAFDLGPGVFRPFQQELEKALAVASSSLASRSVLSSGSLGSDPSVFTRDLIALAKKVAPDPVLERDSYVRRLVQILERRGKNHPLIVGEPGVGKTALIRALADRMAKGDAPSNLRNAKLVELDTGALVAGARLRGELEQRVKELVTWLADHRTDVILVVENFDLLLGQGAVGIGVGELLKPLLSSEQVARHSLRLLGTTTPEGLRKMQERDAGLLRRVTLIELESPTLAQAIQMLRGVATRYENHHDVRIGEAAIVSAVQLAKRYLQDRQLPDSAIDLLDETSARKRVELEGFAPEMDDLVRRLDSVQVQIQALENDEDEQSVRKRRELEAEAQQLSPRVNEAKAKLQSRAGALAAAKALEMQLAKEQKNLEIAREKRDFARLGELEHVTIPDLKRRCEAAQAAAREASNDVGRSGKANVVTDQDIAQTLGNWTGIPVAKMLEAETDKLIRMQERLKQRIVGQDEALLAVSKAVRRGRVGLRDPRRPIGSFLFLGPSGVGKTELAKALAAFLFDDEQALTRLDMSEFMERHMAQRLLGAPPGYVDSEQGGFLTEAVRRRPYSVLLFDEIEKAHSDVFNLLLQLLDDGRLTDGRGRTADFSNTVVIMTSNIGAKRILETDAQLFDSDEGREALRDVLMDELREFFRPEFLNRIDDVIVFRHLSKEHLRGIVDIELGKLDRLLQSQQIRVELTDQAKWRLVELGYEPAFGARPLRRAMLRQLQDPLAEHLLTGSYRAGDVVKVDVTHGELVFGELQSQKM